MVCSRRPDVVDVEEEGHGGSGSGSFGDLEADETLVRFPDPYVLGAAHIDGLDELHAPAMEVLSGLEGKKVQRRGWEMVAAGGGRGELGFGGGHRGG